MLTLDRCAVQNRWREAEQALRALAPICTARDDDGIDLYFLNHKPMQFAPSRAKADHGYWGLRTAAGVSRVFSQVRPRGATPIAPAPRPVPNCHAAGHPRLPHQQHQQQQLPPHPRALMPVHA